MADEINIDVKLSVEKGFLEAKREVRRYLVDMTGDAYSSVVQEIGTSDEALDISSEVGPPGFAFFRNHDDTNFVEIGVNSGTSFDPVMKLNPGDVALVPLATTDLRAKADTAAVALEHWVIEA